MKKVRLFAVAAAMGMFASTVAAAEPVVSTGYTATWEGVEEIIKVDVGNKVVAPVTTIKVVKETRTTDTEYDVTNDLLGFEEDANCLTSTGVANDKNHDNYSDVQIYVNKTATGYVPGYYTSKLDAVKDYLADNHLVLAPGAEESKDDQYYAKYANETFANYEEAYAWLEEKGLIESVYNEEGDLTKIYVNQTQVTDYKGRELANARLEITVPEGRRQDEYTMQDVVESIVNGNTAGIEGAEYVALPNYTAKAELTWAAYLNGDHEGALEPIAKDDIVIVDEYKGELNVIAVISEGDENPYVTGWTKEGKEIAPKATEGKVTVYSLQNNRTKEVVKLSTVSPVEVKAYTPYSTMVWDEVVGSFVKTTDEFEAKWFVVTGEEESVDATTYLSNKNGLVAGFWWGNEHEADKGDALVLSNENLNTSAKTLGLEKIAANETLENETSKWLLLDAPIAGVNTKEEKITLYYEGTKEVVVSAVELDGRGWVPAFDSEETLVKVAAKIWEDKLGVKFDGDVSDEALVDSPFVSSLSFTGWYKATENLANNYWSGYTHEEDLPENELQGPGSEACSYVVSVSSEEVTATVEASEVDTTEAGVKTMTLSAKVDGEVVATKDVKVVVAPRYERTYVNGKVAVLKSFYLDGTLYSEYHYDWAAKTYTATFYANDGVTVASTANGTL